MKRYDYLIIGSGLYGATFAYFAKMRGKKCLVIDKRNNIGGNLYCDQIEGISVHKYGAHIFHTSNESVWSFVNTLVKFNRFTNCPLAYYKGQLFNLPFNMNTFYKMWGVITPEEAEAKINGQKNEALSKILIEGRKDPINLEEQALCLVGKDIYEKLIKGYTEKQWGRKCVELPSFIIKRLPFRLNFDNNYFNDLYQGIPVGGYNKLISKLLEGVETRTDIDYFKNREYWNAISNKIVFTGRIDEYYDYSFGKLEYRSVCFENEIIEKQNFQGNAVVNYTENSIPYTRIIEHKHFEPENPNYLINRTIISKEYPKEWHDGCEPFYPINNTMNDQLYKKYYDIAKTESKVIFGGRLAEYKYYDMDDIIERVMANEELF